MALQKKILKAFTTDTIDVGGTSTSWTSATGALAGGIPGKIYDVAYGPVVHTVTIDTDAGATIGEVYTSTAGNTAGVVINAPEYVLRATAGDALAPSLKVYKGTVVECMTAGHVWVLASKANAIIGTSGSMNGRKLVGPDITTDVSGATEYAKDTAIAANAIVYHNDENEFKTFYKNGTGAEITAATNTGWDAVKSLLTRVRGENELCVIEVNGVK